MHAAAATERREVKQMYNGYFARPDRNPRHRYSACATFFFTDVCNVALLITAGSEREEVMLHMVQVRSPRTHPLLANRLEEVMHVARNAQTMAYRTQEDVKRLQVSQEPTNLSNLL